MDATLIMCENRRQFLSTFAEYRKKGYDIAESRHWAIIERQEIEHVVLSYPDGLDSVSSQGPQLILVKKEMLRPLSVLADIVTPKRIPLPKTIRKKLNLDPGDVLHAVHVDDNFDQVRVVVSSRDYPGKKMIYCKTEDFDE
jgi:hypothetical protein